MEDIPAILREHVTLQVESVDRVYLNGYIPRLQCPGGVYHWLREVRRMPIPSPSMLGATTAVGFKVHCQLDQTPYPTGIHVTDEELEHVQIEPHECHPQWNYRIRPHVRSES